MVIDPHKVWAFYKSNKGMLSYDTHEIMADDTGNISVRITDEDDELEIYVMVNGIVSYSKSVCDEESCFDAMDDIMVRYFQSDEDAIKTATDEDLDEFIDENEKNIDDIVSDLVSALIDDITEEQDFDDICDGVKDLVCEHLAYNIGVRVYRPMILEDENGEDFYTDNPYDYLEQ